jgi:hypothetical protein
LVKKAKHDLEIGDDAEVDEASWDHDVAPPADPQAEMSESPAQTYTLEDGTCLECWGDDESGYEVRHGKRSLPTRFPNIDHADMAVRLFQKRRQKQDLSQDYIEEK